MIDELCESCIGKTTTTQCKNCNTKYIQIAIKQLDEFIKAHKSNLSQYIFFINTLYIDIIKTALNYDLTKNLDIRFISILNKKEMCVIIDKKSIDWGNINIDYNYMESEEIESGK